jgi:serine/threonine-protein kinase
VSHRWLNSLILVLPNYTCAIVATLPARFLRRVGRRLREAQELGSYQLIELLGQGGMGECGEPATACSHGAPRSSCATRSLGARNDAESSVILRRFEREARATAALSSPHTIHVFDFGVTDEGTFYYVMELLIGRDLEISSENSDRSRLIAPSFLLRQVCHSLADAHAGASYTATSSRPTFMCAAWDSSNDFAKVLDFGLVKDAGRAPGYSRCLRSSKRRLALPPIWRPKSSWATKTVDSRADVYALGCVAYFCSPASSSLKARRR